ncbi:hypothetical protein RCR19_01780 [Streptomyces sp. WAC07094]|uniref:hypothetical protein n=1 Tax=unclassified Streptomyces TaxID=2593676 RepID=UPI002EBFFC7F|nr:hypothetical protein [Streptomyces sp. WAC07094]
MSDPDSIGIHVRRAREAELEVVLYRGGWADVDHIASINDAGAIPAPPIRSAQAFGALLDSCVTRVFGLHSAIE